jgi:hypothetical protein
VDDVDVGVDAAGFVPAPSKNPLRWCRRFWKILLKPLFEASLVPS